MKIIFKLNKDLEIDNIYHCVNTVNYSHSFRSRMNPVLVENIEGKTLEESQKIIKAYVDEYYEKNNDLIDKRIEDLEKIWSLVDNKIEDRILQVTSKPFPFEIIKVFLTLSMRCNYNYKELWFKVPITSNILFIPSIMLHELLHFYYYYYYENEVLQELNKEESEDLKESLTFIINVAFGDVVVSSDKGYPIHQHIRDALAKFWDKNKNYDELMREGIRIMVSLRKDK